MLKAMKMSKKNKSKKMSMPKKEMGAHSSMATKGYSQKHKN